MLKRSAESTVRRTNDASTGDGSREVVAAEVLKDRIIPGCIVYEYQKMCMFACTMTSMFTRANHEWFYYYLSTGGTCVCVG